MNTYILLTFLLAFCGAYIFPFKVTRIIQSFVITGVVAYLAHVGLLSAQYVLIIGGIFVVAGTIFIAGRGAMLLFKAHSPHVNFIDFLFDFSLIVCGGICTFLACF